MTARHLTPGWGLLLVGGVLTVCVFSAGERSSPPSASEGLRQDCALEGDRPTASEPCAEVAERERFEHAAGETAWPTQC
jgi:hypothetical protein